jgi:hypothetical protein
MADQLIQRAGETARWLERLSGSKHDAGRSIMWAAFNLRTARMGERIAAELGSGSAGVARVRAVFHEEWDVLEIGAMSLGFEDVMTALDLCANAVYLVSGGTPTSDGAYKDLGYWTPGRLVKLPSNTHDWLLALQAHPDKHLLAHCRTELAHRAVQRHVIRGAGGAASPPLTEMTIPAVGGDPPARVSIGVLIPRLVEFGKDQFLRCCAALEADFKPS